MTDDAQNASADAYNPKQTVDSITLAAAGFEQTRARLLEASDAAAEKLADAIRFSHENIEAFTRSAQL